MKPVLPASLFNVPICHMSYRCALMLDEERVFYESSSGHFAHFPAVADANDKRMSLFKGRMAGLVRWAAAHGCMIDFLTLTVADPSTMDIDVLNKLMNFMRARFKRAGLPFKYAWVLEPQMRRYEDTGVLAPHWHIAIACPVGSLPNVEFRESAPRGQKYHMLSDGRVIKQSELYKCWGYGQMLCQPARTGVMEYMAKYMAKALEFAGVFGHRFGSSMMTWWKVSRWAFECAYEFYRAGMDILHVSFTSGNSARLLHLKVTDGRTMEFYTIPSPWIRVQ